MLEELDLTASAALMVVVDMFGHHKEYTRDSDVSSLRTPKRSGSVELPLLDPANRFDVLEGGEEWRKRRRRERR